MESVLINTFSPEIIFKKLDGYITQVLTLENIVIKNPRKFESRTLGRITIAENLGEKTIQIVKDGTFLYSATKLLQGWEVKINLLSEEQIKSIQSLPQNKNEVFLEFFARTLTIRLKEIFQAKSYPIESSITLSNAQVPYKFYIAEQSTNQLIIFRGTNEEGEQLFKSSFSFGKDGLLVRIIENELPFDHLSQLCD